MYIYIYYIYILYIYIYYIYIYYIYTIYIYYIYTIYILYIYIHYIYTIYILYIYTLYIYILYIYIYYIYIYTIYIYILSSFDPMGLFLLVITSTRRSHEPGWEVYNERVEACPQLLGYVQRTLPLRPIHQDRCKKGFQQLPQKRGFRLS